MPQLDFFIFKNLTLSATIVFLILSYIFYIQILPSIFKALKTRKELENFLNPSSPEIINNQLTPLATLDHLVQLTNQLENRKTTITTLHETH